MLGRSIFAPWPAVVAVVRGHEAVPPFDPASARLRLLRHLGAAGRSAPDWHAPMPGFGEPAAEFARLAAWLAVVLQNAAGGRVADFAATRSLDGVLHSACGYQDGVVGRAALMIAGRLAAAALDPDWEGPTQALRGAVANVVALGLRAHHDHNTRVLVERAARRDIPVYRVMEDHGLMQLGQGARQQHFIQVMGSRFEYLGSLLCEKDRTHAVLRRIGVPVAVQRRVESVEAAQRAAAELGGLVVLKPSRGHGGAGVTVGVSDPDDVARAFRKAEAANAGAVLLETFVPGDDYRLLLIDGRLVAAARRIPGHVIGDGSHTVAELAAILNGDPRRGSPDIDDLVRLDLDDEADRVLAGRGYDRATVPAPGEVVFLRAVANISSGGIAEDVLDRVHPAVRQLAEVVARAFRLEIMGIDYLTVDIGRAPAEAGGVICEVNRSPGLRPHAQPPAIREGIFDALLDKYFGMDGNGRIPVALVTGTSGKTTTCRMVAAMFEASGAVTGLAGTDGVTVGGRVLRRGDSSGAIPARMALFDPTTEAAVLEVGRGGILRYGLSVDAADVVAVLNVGHDHIGQDGAATLADIARAKAVTIAAARRSVVLNADDPHCRAMAALSAVPVVWFARDRDNATVAAHLAGGGTAVYVAGARDSGRIAIEAGGQSSDVAQLADVPATLGGIVEANVSNALAAVAVGHGLGLSREAIAAGLGAITTGFESNPGRFNLLRAGSTRVLVDSPSCVDDIEALRRFLEHLPPIVPRVVALAHPGDYADAIIARFAEAFAGGFDHYVCYDWEELRGRAPGAVAALLGAALLSAGIEPARVAVIPDERTAVQAAIAMAGADGLAVLAMPDEREPQRSILTGAGIDGWAFAGVAAWMEAGRPSATPLARAAALD